MTKFRHLIWMSMATLGLILSASQSFAQGTERDDQPGLIADDSYQLDPEWQKQIVYYRTTEAPGTIIVSTAERHLYLVQPGGRAIRYGIGVGRDGFQWQGLLNISKKAECGDQRTGQATKIHHFKLSPLHSEKSIESIKTQGQLHGKFWAEGRNAVHRPSARGQGERLKSSLRRQPQLQQEGQQGDGSDADKPEQNEPQQALQQWPRCRLWRHQ